MIRGALRTATIASSSLRPVIGRGIARPSIVSSTPIIQRGYHAKVIDHYENPRNVRGVSLLPP